MSKIVKIPETNIFLTFEIEEPFYIKTRENKKFEKGAFLDKDNDIILINNEDGYGTAWFHESHSDIILTERLADIYTFLYNLLK